MANGTKWQISGDYFENCNCDVVCPCLVSTAPPLVSRPTDGACDVAVIVHIDKGRYGDVQLDGLNVAVIAHTPGPMGEGNWTVASYLDERANDRQAEAIGTIMSGSVGGPMAAFAPLIGKDLGTKKVPISYQINGKKRSVKIPKIMTMSVRPLASLREGEEMWLLNSGNPFNPEKVALAVGDQGSTFADHGMSWDNSGKNGHYAQISWAN